MIVVIVRENKRISWALERKNKYDLGWEKNLVGKNNGKSEGGSGGNLGHSNMNHWTHTSEVKNDSRYLRRREDREQSEEGKRQYNENDDCYIEKE